MHPFEILSEVQMIDVFQEDLIDLRQACREPVFRNRLTKKPAHIASVYRYVMRGARAANGERIRLETVRTPRGMLTSREAIVRFIEALTNPDTPTPTPTSATRRRQIEQAEKELAEAGML